MSKITLIDGDTIIWLSIYNTKEQSTVKSIRDAIDCCDHYINNIFQATEAELYSGFLTDGSFRYKIATIKPYKGNRAGLAKPLYFNTIKSYLIDEYKFISIKDYEADDLCIAAHFTLSKDNEVTIASPDKDLRQVEGKFYDYKKQELSSITNEEAQLNLWRQVLTGDTGDNIPGLSGVGPVKANKLLIQPYSQAVLQEYIKCYGEHIGILNFTENYRLIKMLETVNDQVYLPPLHEVTIKSDIDAWLQ